MILSKERTKQDVRRRKKEEEEEEWRRVEREREDQNRRRMWEFKNVDLESRNLNETNFDFGRYNEKIARLNKRGKRKNEDGGGREGVGPEGRGEKRERTPVQYAERELKVDRFSRGVFFLNFFILKNPKFIIGQYYHGYS